MSSLSRLAEDVLFEVSRATQEKTAAEKPVVRLTTPVGQSFMKLASELRRASSSGPTYADLARFRETYGI